nr:hypothetical protein [Tanacetum cinerariifolium]
TRQSFPNEAQWRASKPLELVHADLCGPITLQSTEGNGYFLLIIDDWCRYMWVYLLRSKDESLAKFKIFKAQDEMETAHKVKVLRTDRGERRNRTVVEMTRLMLKSMNLPDSLWAEAVRHAVYLLNRLPTKVGGHLTKLEDRIMPMVHLGMELGSKAYRLYNPKSKRIVVARDVLFDEAKSWTWEATQESMSGSMVQPIFMENTESPQNASMNQEEGPHTPLTLHSNNVS